MDLMSILGQVKTAEDEALARQVITAMLGSAAAQPIPNQGQPRSVQDTQLANITANFMGTQQIPSVEAARALLGNASTPAPTQRESADVVMQSPAASATPQQSPDVAAQEAASSLATIEQNSKVADILDALPVWNKSQDAAERVNANTAVYGVKATKDANGQVTLTNVVDGKVTPQSQSKDSFNPMDGGLHTKIKSMMDEINAAGSTADAMSKAGPLRSALIEETTKMQNTALEQAEAELGLPKLRRALQASQTADQMLPNWSPAAGDSPNTAKIRGQIVSVENQVKQKASDWLGRNITYRQLQETARTAEAAITLATTKSKVAEDRRELKTAQQEELDLIKYESLPMDTRMLISRLNPSIEKLPVNEIQKAVVAFDQRELKASPDYKALREASREDYPSLAFSGNKLAVSILAEEEAKVTGMDKTLLESELSAAATSPVEDKDIEQFAIQMAGGDRDAAAKIKSQLVMAKADSSKEAKARYASVEATIRQSRIARARESRFFNTVSSWAPEGSVLQAAATKVRETTGEDSLPAVMASMLDGKTRDEQIALVASVRDALTHYNRKYSNSAYGKTDAGKVLSQFNQMILDQGQLRSSVANSLSQYLVTNPLTAGPGAAVVLQDWMKRQQAAKDFNIK